MKLTFVLCLSVFTLLVSCSQDDFIEDTSVSMSDNTISFTVSDMTDDSDTRSTPVTSSNWKSEMGYFSWFAVDANGNNVIGKPSDNHGLMEGVHEVKPDNVSNEGKVETEYMWKDYDGKGPLTFYAFHGVESQVNFMYKNSDDIAEGSLFTHFDSDKMLLQMSMYNRGNLNSKVPSVNYPDVMVATAKNVTSASSDGGSVSLKFRHLLSRVRLYASCDSRYKVTVNDVRIFYVSAFFNYDIKTGDIETNVLRERLPAWYENTVSPSFQMESDVTLSDKPQEMIPKEGAMFFAPQTVQTWDVKKSNLRFDAPTRKNMAFACVQFTCKIYDTVTDKYIVGDDSSFGNVHYPLTGTWESGKCYNYYFRFDRQSHFGYDIIGNPTVNN